MSNKAIVLDANILIRAVLGKRCGKFLLSTRPRSNSLRLIQLMPMPENTCLRC